MSESAAVGPKGWYKLIDADDLITHELYETSPDFEGFQAAALMAAETPSAIAFRFGLHYPAAPGTEARTDGWDNTFYIGGTFVPYASDTRFFEDRSQRMEFWHAMERRRAGTNPDFVLRRGSHARFEPLYHPTCHHLPLDDDGLPQWPTLIWVWRTLGLGDPAMAQSA